MVIDQPEKFLHFTSTGWTALGSIVSAVSILVLSVFSVLNLLVVRKQANAAKKSLKLIRKQMAMAERPFVAIHSKYDEELGAPVVYAVSQGAGPALDVYAHLDFKPGAESGQSEYTVGCLAKDEKFQFLIGMNSAWLSGATLRYKSVSGQRWRTTISLLGGNSMLTKVSVDTEKAADLEVAFDKAKDAHMG